MLGNLITRIRTEKGISKTDLSKATGINVGHLTHIEKGDRNPSHKLLKTITSALGVPFEPLYHAYDKKLEEQQIEFNYVNHMVYNQIPVFSDLDFINCPANFSNATFAYRVFDNAMEPTIPQNSYVYVEQNAVVHHKEIGLFKLNDKFIIRKLIYKKDHFVLKANNKSFDDIVISNTDKFFIIGKIYV